MVKELIVTGRILIEETTQLSGLIIEEGGSLTAPEGKFVQLSVDGIGKEIRPGKYYGDVVLSIADLYVMPPHGLVKMANIYEDFRNVIVIKDNEVAENYSVPALIRKGTVTGRCADGIEILSEEKEYNGILVTGDSDYTIKNAKLCLEGMGRDDFAGVGAGVAAIDNAKVTIEDSEIYLNGVTRCAVHVGGESIVHVNRCRLENESPANDEWMSTFSWGFAALGTNRLTQLCDNGTVYYTDCDLHSNGWGIFSIDGCDDAVAVYVKDCRVDLSGPRSHGYVGFCIGDRNVVSFDHTKINVSAFPVMVRGMMEAARVDIVNGCDITSGQNGIFCFGDLSTPVNIFDSRMKTRLSALVVKGSSTKFYLKNAELLPGNGVVMQLMDNDECGMDVDATVLPVGKTDTYVEGRDLSAYNPKLDVSVELCDMNVCGDFYNSTTELHMEKDAVKASGSLPPAFGGLLTPKEGELPPEPESTERAAVRDEYHYDDEQRGAKNLLVEMKSAHVEGIISSASESHREGITQITPDNRCEMGVVTQKAQPTVNNGVIVRMDRYSTWLVTGTSYITSLSLEDTSILKGYGGRKLVMTVDGKEVPAAPGTYTGKIVLSLA